MKDDVPADATFHSEEIMLRAIKLGNIIKIIRGCQQAKEEAMNIIEASSDGALSSKQCRLRCPTHVSLSVEQRCTPLSFREDLFHSGDLLQKQSFDLPACSSPPTFCCVPSTKAPQAVREGHGQGLTKLTLSVDEPSHADNVEPR
ncbi:hypothetical protein EYF80_055106 [Liparis tanakae]|uniref:Uncharacterized protein n=1 Tax=Liparis tanakae TaxID=230148 RepID=A0A4Z2F0R3_9TELE|nr:hypothetical protein EYF80_055106 [Liparis tanakae]